MLVPRLSVGVNMADLKGSALKWFDMTGREI